jgi:phage head maturation protease
LTAHVNVKADGNTVSAMFSVYSVIDKDDDVILPGAIGNRDVVISAYNHSSWGPYLPVGKGAITTSSAGATVNATFFKSRAAVDTLEVIRELGPLQQWSFGFDVLDREQGEFQGQRVRFLKSLDVFEVSPVLCGANDRAHTVSVDGSPSKASLAAMRDRLHRDEMAEIQASLVLHSLALQNYEVQR